MVSQRIGQILCGYEDANDCNQLRGDSVLKMSVGRKPSNADLASQPTMTRLENNVGMKTLYKIGKLLTLLPPFCSSALYISMYQPYISCIDKPISCTSLYFPKLLRIDSNFSCKSLGLYRSALRFTSATNAVLSISLSAIRSISFIPFLSQ